LASSRGRDKPVVPSVMGGNRAKNGRVQFIILAQDQPAKA
jgi:hypothetical protein